MPPINPSYNKPSPAASIGWGGFVSATWGRYGMLDHWKIKHFANSIVDEYLFRINTTLITQA
jgi:hypothetical protein